MDVQQTAYSYRLYLQEPEGNDLQVQPVPGTGFAMHGHDASVAEHPVCVHTNCVIIRESSPLSLSERQRTKHTNCTIRDFAHAHRPTHCTIVRVVESWRACAGAIEFHDGSSAADVIMTGRVYEDGSRNG